MLCFVLYISLVVQEEGVFSISSVTYVTITFVAVPFSFMSTQIVLGTIATPPLFLLFHRKVNCTEWNEASWVDWRRATTFAAAVGVDESLCAKSTVYISLVVQEEGVFSISSVTYVTITFVAVPFSFMSTQIVLGERGRERERERAVGERVSQ